MMLIQYYRVSNVFCLLYFNIRYLLCVDINTRLAWFEYYLY